MTEEILASIEAYFPSFRKMMVEYEIVSNYEMIVVLNDGMRFTFDYIDKTMRRLPAKTNNPDEDDFKREFGIRLKKLMYRKGLTQNELAEKTGIPQPQISNYIVGKNSPSFFRVEKIAKALGCSLDELRYR